MKKPSVILVTLTAAFALILLGLFVTRIPLPGFVNVYTKNIFQHEIIDSTVKKPTVNINTSSKEQLQDLPGIGPSTAQAIIEYREKYGPFKKKQDLLNVSGIGEKTYEELKSFISVDDQ